MQAGDDLHLDFSSSDEDVAVREDLDGLIGAAAGNITLDRLHSLDSTAGTETQRARLDSIDWSVGSDPDFEMPQYTDADLNVNEDVFRSPSATHQGRLAGSRI